MPPNEFRPPAGNREAQEINRATAVSKTSIPSPDLPRIAYLLHRPGRGRKSAIFLSAQGVMQALGKERLTGGDADFYVVKLTVISTDPDDLFGGDRHE